MLLSRVTKHVKEQNWFAVGIDFLIVVVGILIAFQITNWSTARGDRRVYDQAYERLIGELNRNLETQEWLRESIAIELPIIQSALESLRVCRADEDALANVTAAIVPLNSPYIILFENAALEQFLGNDAFLQYQSPETREVLIELSRVSNVVLAQDQARLAQLSQTSAAGPGALSLGPLKVSGPDEILTVMLSDNPLSQPLHREPIITVPLEEACKDKAFLGLLYDWEADAFRISITAGMLQPQLRRALAVLGRPVTDQN